MFETFQTLINAGGYDLEDITEGDDHRGAFKQAGIRFIDRPRRTRGTRRQMAGIQAAYRRARRLPRRRQNHLQREALHVRAGRVRVASGQLPAGVAGRGMTRIYTGTSKW